MYMVNHNNLYNYADDSTIVDRTIVCKAKTIQSLEESIELYGNVLTEWVQNNGMKANPEKYQAIVFGYGNQLLKQFKVKSCSIQCQSNDKLLGLYIDEKLSFDHHIENICKKAGQQINVIMRLCKTLDVTVKESFTVLLFGSCVLKQILKNWID